jgi:hypothetical protein
LIWPTVKRPLEETAFTRGKLGQYGVLGRIDDETVEMNVLTRVARCKCWTGRVDVILLSPQSQVEHFAPPRTEQGSGTWDAKKKPNNLHMQPTGHPSGWRTYIRIS